MLPTQEISPEIPLIRAKFSIPLLPSEFVHRHRLTDRIARSARGPLTLLSAPAGFGKTSLLAEWARESEVSVAWLTLSDEDNDLSRFFRYFTGALQEIVPQFGEEALDFLQSAKTSGLEMGLTLLINEIAGFQNNIVFVLDEFHMLTDPVIHQSLNFLLKHLPPRLHLVIAGRSEPALDIASLRAKGRVNEWGVNELRFTGEEISLFFSQVIGLQLPSETIQALEERTEGWVTALQLAAVSLRNQSDVLSMLTGFHGDAHYLVDFLVEEVLSRQPEEVRRFLLCSSILNILSGPLCEAVVDPNSQPGYGAAMLDRIEHANLFVAPLDQKHEWFRYHRLFADFLRHVLGETYEVEIPLLHKRAATWFEQHGNLDEAFSHALATGDGEWAADLIERNVSAMIRMGDIFTLNHWIEKLPNVIIHQHPPLGLAYAWGLIAAYKLDNAGFWIEDTQRTLDMFEEQQGQELYREPVESARLRSIQGGLAVCRSMLALITGDVRQAAQFSRMALDYLPEDNPFIHSLLDLERSMYFILSGDTSAAIEALRKTARIARAANSLFVLVVATCELAETQAMQGHLSQALATLQKAQFLALGPDGNPLPLAGIVDIEVGEILYERDRLQEARESLERGRRLTESWWSLSSLDGMASLARLLQSQGDIDGSGTLIMEASRLALSTESSQWDDVFTSAIAARLALQRHDLANAAQWWTKIGNLDGGGDIPREEYPYYVFEYLQLTRARFYLAVGQNAGDVHQLRQALELLQAILPDVERLKRVTSKIEILVLQALTTYALGETDQAVSTLLRALALGEPEDYRRVYLDEGQPLAELLPHCCRVQQESGSYLPSPGYIESLLEALRPADSAAPLLVPADERQAAPMTARTEDGFPISLSAREMEVLSLIAAGKSNREIAAELFLALNTVKRHAYNIYAKLGVNKRTHAVSKARRLGLIP